MILGYILHSTTNPHLDTQKETLLKANCQKIIIENETDDLSEKLRLSKIKNSLKSGDTLIVCSLGSLCKSLKDLIDFMKFLNDQEIDFICLAEPINTTTKEGNLKFQLFLYLYEFEKNIKSKKIISGLSKAKEKGRRGGRPMALCHSKRQEAIDLYLNNEMTVDDICFKMNITKPTLLRYVKRYQ